MNKSRKLLQEALQVAAIGEPDMALRKLADGIELAAGTSDERWLPLLHRNIGILYEQRGNLKLAKKSYLMALKYDKSDPYLLYSLADVSRRMGRETEAR